MTDPFEEPPSGVWYSPDGEQILITSSEYHYALLLSATNGEPQTRRIRHFASGANNQHLAPRFDVTGKRLLTLGSPGTARVWNTADASPLGPEISILAPIAWADFSPDGTQILALTPNGEMMAWNWQTGAAVKPPAEFGSLIGRPVPSPDGSRVVTISADRRVRVQDAKTKKPLTPPIDHNPNTGPPEFSASGRCFFTTRPLCFKGNRLSLNYATSAAGSIRIEIQDLNGSPAPGFSLEESPVLYGDQIDEVVEWDRPLEATFPEDYDPLGKASRRPVRLRFVMKDADLYSFRFH